MTFDKDGALTALQDTIDKVKSGEVIGVAIVEVGPKQESTYYRFGFEARAGEQMTAGIVALVHAWFTKFFNPDARIFILDSKTVTVDNGHVEGDYIETIKDARTLQ